jgi:hypothetical protein
MSTSASKSSAETKSETSNVDKRIVADNGAIVLGDGSKLETVSDDIALGAIHDMLSASQTGMALAGKVNEDSLNFAQNISGQSVTIQSQALDTVRESNASTSGLTEVMLAAMQKNTQPATTSNDSAMKIVAGVAAVAVIGAVVAFRRK